MPMSFYDTTPKGRLLNRFTKDVDSLDDELRQNLLFFLFTLGAVISTILAIMYSTPIFTVVALALGAFFVYLQVGSLVGERVSNRCILNKIIHDKTTLAS